MEKIPKKPDILRIVDILRLSDDNIMVIVH